MVLTAFCSYDQSETSNWWGCNIANDFVQLWSRPTTSRGCCCCFMLKVKRSSPLTQRSTLNTAPLLRKMGGQVSYKTSTDSLVKNNSKLRHKMIRRLWKIGGRLCFELGCIPRNVLQTIILHAVVLQGICYKHLCYKRVCYEISNLWTLLGLGFQSWESAWVYFHIFLLHFFSQYIGFVYHFWCTKLVMACLAGKGPCENEELRFRAKWNGIVRHLWWCFDLSLLHVKQGLYCGL